MDYFISDMVFGLNVVEWKVHVFKLNYNFSCKWCLQYFGPSSGIQPQNPVGEECEHLI